LRNFENALINSNYDKHIHELLVIHLLRSNIFGRSPFCTCDLTNPFLPLSPLYSLSLVTDSACHTKLASTLGALHNKWTTHVSG